MAAVPSQAQHMVRDQKRVLDEAKKKNLLVHKQAPDGRGIGLRAFYKGMPLYYKTFNATAARSTSTYPLYPGGAAGLSLTGAGIKLGVWDESQVRLDHVEFNGRAVQRDIPYYLSDHATHVAGTMIAAGVRRTARGMSFEADIDCFDWFNDTLEMDDMAQNENLRVSNHSYGLIVGWIILYVERCDVCLNEPLPDPPFAWFWFGDVTVSQVEDFFFGYYSAEAREWDALSVDNPRYLWVKAAGNDRDYGPTPGFWHYYWDAAGAPNTVNCGGGPFLPGCWRLSHTPRNINGNNGYDTISHSATAKNGLVVGAVNDVPNGYQSPAGVTMSSFSSWGPTDDGRIKPDIVGNGVNVLSCIADYPSAYDSYSGTSMASPNVSGSIGLLLQHWRNTHSGDEDMLSSTIRGLVIHTADECGSAPGPDYAFGWGLMNTRRAAELISRDQSLPLTISEHTLNQGELKEWFIVSDPAASELRVTICWIDPAPASLPPVSVDPRNRVLVNDLDLRVLGTTLTYEPWVLDVENPSFPATRGDNIVDNVEQVVVPTTVSNAYRVRVSHKGMLNGGAQTFSMIISGAKSIRSEPENVAPLVESVTPAAGASVGLFNTVVVYFNEPVFGVLPSHLSVGGSPAALVGGSGAGPYTFSGYATPADGAVNVQLLGGAQDMFGNAFTGASWSYQKTDCNANGIFDSQDVNTGASADCNRNGIPDECDADILRLVRPTGEVVPYAEVKATGAATFVAGGVPPLSYQWTIITPSGAVRSGSNVPAFAPTEAGDYEARLSVSDSTDCTVSGVYFIRVEADEVVPVAPPILGGGGVFCPFMGLLAVAATLAGMITLCARRRSKPRTR